MKNILFIVIPEKGHINPSIGVAQYLQRKGHNITFSSTSDISNQLIKAGFKNYLGPKTTNNNNQGAEFTVQVKNKAWLRAWIKELLISRTPEAIEPMRSIISDFDIVVCDPMIYPAVIACELEKVKWVALSNSLNPILTEDIQSDLLETISNLASDRAKLFAGLNIQFTGCDALSPHLTIAFTTPEFVGSITEGVELVGPAQVIEQRGDEVNFPWDKIDPNLPLIYVSFGSQIYHQPELFSKLFKIVSDKSIQIVAAVHDLTFDNAPDNVILTGYTPQLALLERASVIITHGGANSVMEAIAANVPILINPICNDQFHQAHFLEQNGCGKRIDLETMNAQQLWESINWALNADISSISSSYQVNGSLKAADLINSL